MRRFPPALLLLIGLSGCGSMYAARAKNDLVGLTELELKMCAGIPAKAEVQAGNQIEVWQYEFSTQSDGVKIPIPVIGDLSLGGSTCHAVFRIQHGAVVEVRYSGDTDSVFGPDAACGPIVQACVRAPEHIPQQIGPFLHGEIDRHDGAA